MRKGETVNEIRYRKNCGYNMPDIFGDNGFSIFSGEAMKTLTVQSIMNNSCLQDFMVEKIH